MTALPGRRKTDTVTLAHIAERAGVSPITASRALRGSGPVAEETRVRILAAAEELGYVPNLLARGLVQNRTATVGVVILEVANPFFAPILSAIESVADRRGFLVVIGESGMRLEGERRYVERFQQMRIGGMIVTPATTEVDHLTTTRAAGTPVVAIARRWAAGDFVTADNVEGGRMVARHFLTRGHRRIGLVRPEVPENTAIQDRVRGFREELAAAGVTIPDRWDIRTPWTLIEEGMEAGERLAAQAERPSAVFTATDRQAMGIVHQLLARGIRVPEDIAVVGYDDLPYAACAQVPLTSVAIHMRRMGELAAEILFDRLDGTGAPDPRQILLQPELIVRASSP
jgi:LacI family transcriptional regulator